jgi:tetratricopeptide (TPR) repeat protein
MVARALQADRLTPADEVRRLLSSCEQALGGLAGSSDSALTILRGLDRVHDLLPDLEARGMDLRPERTRLATLEGELQRRATDILRTLRPAGGLAGVRPAGKEERQRWWWYIDEQVREKRGRTTRRVLVLAAGVLALLAVLAVAYQRFLAPDPLTARGLQLQAQGEMLARSGDYAGALERLDGAQALLPASGELYAWRGVLKTLIGQPKQAAELFDSATALFGDTGAFLVTRGQTYLQLQELALAGADAGLILENDPGSPQGHLLRGSVLEARGAIGEAIAAFEAASRFADERKMAELSAVARFRMGIVSQQGAMPQLGQ